MNPKQLYLAWVRSTFPNVYTGALTQLLSPKAGLSGLGDDLTSSITASIDAGTYDPQAMREASANYSSPVSDVSISPDVQNSIDQANQTSSSSSAWGDFFNNLSSAISNVGSSVLQTQAQANLLQINTQRAQQGLPPLNQYGVPVTAQQLAPTSSSIAQFEANLAQTGITSPILWIAIAGIVGVALFANRGRG